MTWSDADRALLDVVDRAVEGAPRSAQRALGPSQLGTPCGRELTWLLAGRREPRHPYGGWQAAVGTAVHAWLEGAFTAENRRLGDTRYVLEARVMVGEYAGRRVWGTGDLYDLDTGTVVDWKTASPSSLRRHRDVLGPQYDAQRHLYGRGFALLGLPVREVVDVFLPRDGNLTAAYAHRAPYDEPVAVAALGRAESAQHALDAVGGDPEAVPADDCGRAWCFACREVRPPRSIFG